MVLFAQDYPNKKHIFEQIRLQVEPHPNKNTLTKTPQQKHPLTGGGVSGNTKICVTAKGESCAAKVTLILYLNYHTALAV